MLGEAGVRFCVASAPSIYFHLPPPPASVPSFIPFSYCFYHFLEQLCHHALSLLPIRIPRILSLCSSPVPIFILSRFFLFGFPLWTNRNLPPSLSISHLLKLGYVISQVRGFRENLQENVVPSSCCVCINNDLRG